MINEMRSIEITVKAPSGYGKSTIASHIAAYLYDIGFYVVQMTATKLVLNLLKKNVCNQLSTKIQ